MSGDDEIKDIYVNAKILLATPTSIAEEETQIENDFEEVLKDEPMVDVRSDHEEYPEMELKEEIEEDRGEAQTEPERGTKEEEVVVAVIDDQVSTEVQVLNNRVFILEEMWIASRGLIGQFEVALREVVEERDMLKVHINKMEAECSVLQETPNKKRKGKWIYKSNNKQKDLKKGVKECKNCGKNHTGVCLKGKDLCYKCGQEGHIAPSCPNPRKKGACYVCGSLDHQAKGCPKKAGERSGKE